jgi:hypothetical protein
MHSTASTPLVATFIVIALALVVAFVWAIGATADASTRGARAAAAIGSALWLGVTASAALSGQLARFDARPPPFALLFVASLVLALSPVGARLARLPLAALVGVQSFRLPLELAMHEAARQGVMPERMSFGGSNFDIVTGVLAIPLALALARGYRGRAFVLAWNALGFVLLANVLVNAVLATPMVHAFGTSPGDLNTFVAYFPFVWLPSVMVVAALTGHIVIARRLGADRTKASSLSS